MAVIDGLVARLRAALGEPLVKSLRRRLRAASPAALSELREGLHCRIAGSVRALDSVTLEAPLSGERCVAYLFEVVELSVERDLLVYDKRAIPFMLADGDAHHAVIDPSHVELLVTGAQKLTSRYFQIEPQQRALLDRYCPDRLSWDMMGKLAFREVLVKLGDRVSIAGTGHREADPLARRERGFRDHVQRLRLVGSQQLPLLIGDEVRRRR
mgnify:CR=1 FL=1